MERSDGVDFTLMFHPILSLSNSTYLYHCLHLPSEFSAVFYRYVEAAMFNKRWRERVLAMTRRVRRRPVFLFIFSIGDGRLFIAHEQG